MKSGSKIFFTLLVIVLLISIISFSKSFNTDQTIKTAGLDLGQKFRFYGSDKDVNGYTSLYYTLFDHLKDQPINILEIGIGTMIPGVHSSMVGYSGENYKPGGSLRAWRDYFTNGMVYAIDVQPDTQFTDEPRIQTYLYNSTDKNQVNEMMKGLGNIKFDIIIDDGSHIDSDQFKTLENFYPYVKEGGYYIIEDIYPHSAVSNKPQQVSSYSNGDPYFFVGVKNNLCVIYKSHLERDGTTYKY